MRHGLRRSSICRQGRSKATRRAPRLAFVLGLALLLSLPGLALATPQADLATSLVDAPDPTFVGNLLTYTVTVHNLGPSEAPNAGAHLTLPAGFVPVGVPGACAVNLAQVSCEFGTLAPNGSASLSLVGRPAHAGFHTAMASSFSEALDPQPGNDLASANTSVLDLLVNSVDDLDDGACDFLHCSLREAIRAANANPGRDLVRFGIPGPGPYTIRPESPLPAATTPMDVDASSQPGHAGQPVVELDGSLAGAGTSALRLSAGQSAVRGLVINRFDGHGLVIQDGQGSVVEGCRIGSGLDGGVPLPNGGHGIFIVGSQDNRIQGNQISANRGSGVLVSTGSGNVVAGNAIFGNAQLGIALGDEGVTPNDPLDADSGANGLQNYPQLARANSSDGATGVVGTLSSAPSAAFTLDFYAGAACDQSGHGQGGRWLGSTSVTTDPTGTVAFAADLDRAATAGEILTATATSASGDTSEFSACVTLLGAPSASLADLALIEGQGPVAALFTVTLSVPSAQTVSIPFWTVDGSAALADGDYLPAFGVLVLQPGAAAQMVAVTVLGDARHERDEAFSFVLGTPVHATLARGSALATLANDDPAPLLSAADLSVNEGTGADTPAAFLLSLDAPSGLPVSVDWQTFDGSATVAAGDYRPASGQVVIPAGQTQAAVTVSVVGDALDENPELFALVLSNPQDAQLGNEKATATVHDDDPQPDLLADSVSVTEGSGEGLTPLSFQVRLSAPSGLPVEFAYATGDGSAQARADYVPTSGRVRLEPGQTSGEVVVRVVADSVFETNETLYLRIFDVVAARFSGQPPEGLVLDDEQAPTLSVRDASVSESPEGGNPVATVVVGLAGVTELPASFDWTTLDGSATGPADYAPSSGRVTIPAGQRQATLAVPIQDDVWAEGEEVFGVRLANPNGATLTRADAQVTILDDDTATLSIADAEALEGNDDDGRALDFQVTLSTPSAHTVEVDYASRPGSAAEGSDFEPVSGTLRLEPGDLSATIQVPVVPDQTFEGDELMSLELGKPHNAGVARAQAFGTIRDDDPRPELRASDVSLRELHGQREIEFQVALSSPSTVDLDVAWSTADESARAGQDYLAGSGGVRIPAGSVLAQPVRVTILGDRRLEPDESFTLALSTDDQKLTARVTIVDDDNPGADLDGDGHADLAFYQPNTGALRAWLMNGLDLQTDVPIARLSPGEERFGDRPAGFGDFDGDGQADLLFQQRDGRVGVWLLVGTQVAGERFVKLPPDEKGWLVDGVADFDGDGQPDILWRNAEKEATRVWFMQGFELADERPLEPARLGQPAWHAAALADFDGDGQTDVMWRDGESGQLTLWRMAGLQRVGELPLEDTLAPNWRSAGSGDFDRDGRADLLFWNEKTGELRVWQMDGSVCLAQTSPDPTGIADTSWELAPRH